MTQLYLVDVLITYLAYRIQVVRILTITHFGRFRVWMKLVVAVLVPTLVISALRALNHSTDALQSVQQARWTTRMKCLTAVMKVAMVQMKRCTQNAGAMV